MQATCHPVPPRRWHPRGVDGRGTDPGGGELSHMGDRARPHIGTLTEGGLHRALKELVSQPGDRFEVPLEGFVVDVLRGDTCIEVQTSGLAAMGPKLDALLGDFHVHVVHPIRVGTWLHRPDRPVRKSPKRACLHDLCGELVSVPTLLDHPNLTIEVLLVHVDAVKVHDPALRRGRGGWRTVDTRLREVVSRHGFRTVDDLVALLPDDLPSPFTTADVARGAGVPRRTAQQLCYVLRANERVVEVGRDRGGVRYERT